MRVSYRKDGDEQTIEKTIRRDEIKPWSDASRRTKAAVLSIESSDPSLRDSVLRIARESGLSDLVEEIEKER